MEKLIEECAQKIVAILGNSREVNLLRLSELLEERSLIIYQAVGWLARDGRLSYAQREKQVFVRLSGRDGGAGGEAVSTAVPPA